YMADLSHINFEQAANGINLPRPQQILDEVTSVGEAQLSPDGRKFAYLSYDPQNPPQNFNNNNPPGKPPSVTFNTIILYDLVAQKKKVVTVNKGQAIETMTWTSDGKQLLFTVGNFNNTNYIAMPSLYSVDTTSGKATNKGTLEKNAQNAVPLFAICGQNLY